MSQSTEYRVQDTEHRVQSTWYRALAVSRYGGLTGWGGLLVGGLRSGLRRVHTNGCERLCGALQTVTQGR